MSEAISTNQPILTPSHLTAVAPSILQTVVAHPEISGQSKLNVAASILDSLSQFMGPIFQVTRSSPRTQMEVALSVGMLEAILHAFVSPSQAGQ